jgi:hypothetical protein
MTRRWAGALIALAALVLLAAIYWMMRGSRGETVAPAVAAAVEPATAAPSPALPAEPTESWPARLYYPAANDRLLPEERLVESGDTAVARATALLRSFLSTPPAAPRVPPFPAAVEVGRVLLLADGTLVADLRSTEADPPASGSTVELLRVYSLVHTLLRNVPDANQVVLLWNGRQRTSFAGHVDTARPLRARPELDAAVPPPAAPAATNSPAAAPATPR